MCVGSVVYAYLTWCFMKPQTGEDRSDVRGVECLGNVEPKNAKTRFVFRFGVSHFFYFSTAALFDVSSVRAHDTTHAHWNPCPCLHARRDRPYHQSRTYRRRAWKHSNAHAITSWSTHNEGCVSIWGCFWRNSWQRRTQAPTLCTLHLWVGIPGHSREGAPFR